MYVTSMNILTCTISKYCGIYNSKFKYQQTVTRRTNSMYLYIFLFSYTYHFSRENLLTSVKNLPKNYELNGMENLIVRQNFKME